MVDNSAKEEFGETPVSRLSAQPQPPAISSGNLPGVVEKKTEDVPVELNAHDAEKSPSNVIEMQPTAPSQNQPISDQPKN